MCWHFIITYIDINKRFNFIIIYKLEPRDHKRACGRWSFFTIKKYVQPSVRRLGINFTSVTGDLVCWCTYEICRYVVFIQYFITRSCTKITYNYESAIKNKVFFFILYVLYWKSKYIRNIVHASFIFCNIQIKLDTYIEGLANPKWLPTIMYFIYFNLISLRSYWCFSFWIEDHINDLICRCRNEKTHCTWTCVLQSHAPLT